MESHNTQQSSSPKQKFFTGINKINEFKRTGFIRCSTFCFELLSLIAHIKKGTAEAVPSDYRKSLFERANKIQNPHKNQDMRLIFIPRPAPTGARNRGYRRWFRQEPSGVSRGYPIPPGSVSNFFDTLKGPPKRSPLVAGSVYFAYSIARVSRMTLTLIWPGYSISSSIRLAISRAVIII